MTTVKQKKAIDAVLENRGSVSAAMRQAGYSEATAKNPKNLTQSKAWKELLAEHLSDESLAEKHAALLNSTKIEHETFALGPKDEADKENYIAIAQAKAAAEGKEYVPREYLTDEDIRQMYAEVNCKVRRIVHRETSRDVYYWAADNKARKDGLDMAYKLKGSYAPEKSLSVRVDATTKTATDKELDALRQEYVAKLKAKLSE